ncbi:MAG: polya polymerase [Lachnospiraceae bacterium]|nr:polya polymerase [Lachnospiraceae bacterium]
MTLTNVTNVEKLFETIKECEGKVELVTEQGDRYNLKSKLSQYVSFVKVLANSTVPNIEIVTYNRVDAQRFIKFMING